MRATITQDGCLTIQAETEVEYYALMRWFEHNNMSETRVNLCLKPNPAGLMSDF